MRRAPSLLLAWLLVLGVSPAASGDDPVLYVEGMTFVSSQGEVTEVVLRAKRARLDTETDIAYLSTVHVTVSESVERQGFDMTCDRGELNLKTNDFLAEGNVIGHTQAGRDLSAPWARYDHEQGLLFTDSPVLITESTGTYRGGGFRYYVREQRFRLLGGASVVQKQ
jgi:LPS export ABC transporter protein LptC